MGQAVEAGVDEANFVVVCTDTFAEKNQGRDTAGLVEQWREAAAAAKDAGLFTTVTLAASFGCPYEGEVPVERLAAVVGAIMQSPPDELALADSIGAAAPTDVRLRLDAAAAVIPDGVALRCHFHNTRNTGVANVAAAVEWGVRAVDASMGGIGGCPFAPNATGNVPTEDVAYMLARMGFDTGVDLQLLADSAPWLEQLLGHGVPGLLGKAGLFPRAVAV
jgi:hydroxymethylglutaryl-CoA lyase